MHKVLIQFRREAGIIIPKIKQKKRLFQISTYLYNVYNCSLLEKRTGLSLQLGSSLLSNTRMQNLFFFSKSLFYKHIIEYSNATCKYLKMHNGKG